MPAAGFVSTAADVARFFAQLAPNAKHSVLSAASRREMTRKHWRNPHASLEGYYGLGIISGSLGGWDWFGHTGGFQGYVSRTCVIPGRDLAITILTNSIDGWAYPWLDGAMHILRAFAARGAPSKARSRLDRALVDDVGRDRSCSDGKSRDRRQSAFRQSVDGRGGNRGHRP